MKDTEIMTDKTDKYEVSIYCLAYNHERFIRNTLESIINQKTNFAYKVIVHDDASTDGTADIIREYAGKYPDIIFPVYQKENQYSQHIDIFANYIVPLLEGKYLAVCECDDMWIDSDKLQIQYDYMSSNPDCSMCVHETKIIDVEGNDLGRNFNNSEISRDYETDEIIDTGGGGLFHTSSFFERTEYRLAVPDVFSVKGVGDYPLSIWFSLCGRIHYINRCMSAYRFNVPGSWTSRNAQ